MVGQTDLGLRVIGAAGDLISDIGRGEVEDCKASNNFYLKKKSMKGSFGMLSTSLVQ